MALLRLPDGQCVDLPAGGPDAHGSRLAPFLFTDPTGNQVVFHFETADPFVLLWESSNLLNKKILTPELAPRAMLHPMPQPDTTASSANASSFAGLLAALTKSESRTDAEWKDGELANEVTDLSYERALRARARYLTSQPTDRSLTGPDERELDEREQVESFDEPWSVPDRSGALPSDDPPPLRLHRDEPVAAAPPPPESYSPAPRSHEDVHLSHEELHGALGALEHDLKCASITIRLSQTECVQLRLRANEAGMTVSAYLRSCAFEVESLRAMVKQTMAQLRTANAPARPTVVAPVAVVSRPWWHFLTRLLPFGRTVHGATLRA